FGRTATPTDVATTSIDVAAKCTNIATTSTYTPIGQPGNYHTTSPGLQPLTSAQLDRIVTSTHIPAK
ncbi:hypothetical protein LTR66_014879, partial [Elasticomyces elasticus]